MLTCPMCELSVKEFKKNCHVVPRAWAKRTKGKDGRNILLDFKNNKIAINQTDYKDEYWCATCESDSSKDDGYGASVLIEKTEGKIEKKNGTKISWKCISGIDYQKFLKFVVSIAIRDHLARGVQSKDRILSEAEFEQLRENYFNRRNDIFIVGNYISETDALSNAITPPVRTRNDDGVSFQLQNCAFLIYLKGKKSELEPISLKKSGEICLVISTSDQTGGLKDVPGGHQKIMENPDNKDQLDRIRKKYPGFDP